MLKRTKGKIPLHVLQTAAAVPVSFAFSLIFCRFPFVPLHDGSQHFTVALIMVLMGGTSTRPALLPCLRARRAWCRGSPRSWSPGINRSPSPSAFRILRCAKLLYFHLPQTSGPSARSENFKTGAPMKTPTLPSSRKSFFPVHPVQPVE